MKYRALAVSIILFVAIFFAVLFYSKNIKFPSMASGKIVVTLTANGFEPSELL
jgi:hypothetical protein